MPRAYRYFDLVMAAFVCILLTSNIASSAKIIDWKTSLWGLPLSFDAGTLLFPVSYIFGDILTEVYGYAQSRRVIWAGFGAALVMSLYLWLVGILPGEAQWELYAGDAAYGAILGGVSSGGIIVASLTAYFAGEFSNSFTLAKMKIITRGRLLWARTIGSTLIGQAIDTTAFMVIATLFGVFPWEIFMSLLVTNYIFKVAIEVIFTPLTYAMTGYLKKAEHEDHFDRETNFNPFRF